MKVTVKVMKARYGVSCITSKGSAPVCPLGLFHLNARFFQPNTTILLPLLLTLIFGASLTSPFVLLR